MNIIDCEYEALTNTYMHTKKISVLSLALSRSLCLSLSVLQTHIHKSHTHTHHTHLFMQNNIFSVGVHCVCGAITVKHPGSVFFITCECVCVCVCVCVNMCVYVCACVCVCVCVLPPFSIKGQNAPNWNQRVNNCLVLPSVPVCVCACVCVCE